MASIWIRNDDIDTQNDILLFLKQKQILPPTGDFEITPLIGGFYNDVFRVRGHGRDWVIKRYRRVNNKDLYPVLPHAEVEALETLRGLDIAPEPIAFFDDLPQPLLIYQFFPGQTWQKDVSLIAHLLVKLHHVPIPAANGFRRLPMKPSELLDQGNDLLSLAHSNPLAARLRANRPPVQPISAVERLSIVHTDTWVGNFIQDGSNIRLIDWQCPGVGDAVGDIWSFIDSGYEILLGRPRFSRQMRDAFLSAYGDAAVIDRLQIMIPYYAYREAAYCCLQHQQLLKTNPFAALAFKQVFDWLFTTLTL